MPNVSHHSGEGGPAYWLLSSPCQPLLQDSPVSTLSIATMLVFQGIHYGSTAVFKKDGAKRDVAGTKLSENVNRSICGWEAGEERESGDVLCAIRGSVKEVKKRGIVTNSARLML